MTGMFDFLAKTFQMPKRQGFPTGSGARYTRASGVMGGAFGPDADSAVASLTWLPEDMELLARENIYAPAVAGSSESGMLLLPAGNVVAPHMLPKLMRHGAKPSQFIIRERLDEDGHSPTLPVKAPAPPAGVTLPESLQNQALASLGLGSTTTTMDMVLVDTNNKHLRKLIDTLTMSGVRMAHLHCTHNPAQLIDWVKKVRPSVLIVDETAHPLTSMVAKLNTLRRTYGIEHVILTVNPQSSPNDVVDRERVLEQARAAGIDVVSKPLNAFSVSKVVRQYKAKLSLVRQLADG
ncbi:MAG: hypothetical protein U0003_02410 [Vampirovibrionales bacterium]